MKENFLQEKHKNLGKGLLYLLGFAGLYMVFNNAMASGGDAEFGDIYNKLTEWSQGTLGKLLALICVVVGTAYTVSRGTLIYAVIGVAICLVLYNAPTIIDSLMDAAVPVEQAVTELPIANGLFK